MATETAALEWEARTRALHQSLLDSREAERTLRDVSGVRFARAGLPAALVPAGTVWYRGVKWAREMRVALKDHDIAWLSDLTTALEYAEEGLQSYHAGRDLTLFVLTPDSLRKLKRLVPDGFLHAAIDRVWRPGPDGWTVDTASASSPSALNWHFGVYPNLRLAWELRRVLTPLGFDGLLSVAPDVHRPDGRLFHPEVAVFLARDLRQVPLPARLAFRARAMVASRRVAEQQRGYLEAVPRDDSWTSGAAPRRRRASDSALALRDPTEFL